ncbi:MAG: ATP-binding protein [Defluviitaleaceae bacterium]|nr:ATP-binding protein [Defluviitaleaceae bacterium]
MTRYKTNLRLFSWMAALSLLGLVVMYFIVAAVVRGIVYENLIGAEQRQITIQAYEVDAWFREHSLFVEFLAETWSITGVVPGETGFGPDPIGAAFLEVSDSFAGVSVSFENGWHVNSSGWIPPENFDASTRLRYVVSEAAGGKVAISLPYIRLSDGDIVASMGIWKPYMMGMEAVVAVDIRLGYLLEMVGRYEISGGGYLMLVGPEGEIIVHPNREFMLSPENEASNIRDIPGGEFLWEAIYARNDFSEFNDYTHGSSYLFSVCLTSVDWTLVAVVPTLETDRLVLEYIFFVMFVFSVFLLTLLFIAFFIVSRISKASHTLELKFQDEKLHAAEESTRAKSAFLARMSHEIRTPVAAVSGISYIQLQNELAPETEEAFAKIFSSANMLTSIINDILELSKIEAGKMEIIPAEYDVASMISDIAHLHLAYLGDKQIIFRLNPDENLPAYLTGDSLRIKQVLSNILSNAFKYTNVGSVELSLAAEDAESGDVILLITVSDTGVGMTDEQLERIYEEYLRFYDNENIFTGGTGLGMSIVRYLLQLMNAEITIESTVGTGTTIKISLPQKRTHPEIIGSKVAKRLQRFEISKKKTKPDIEPMPYGKVLVTDDVETNLYVAKHLISLYEITVETASDGYEAIEKIKAGNKYDIIFMDYMMPGINGTETLQQMRELGYKKPIIALTANAIIGQAEEFLAQGFDGYLSKPIQMKQLDRILVSFIKDKIGGVILNDFQTETDAKIKTDFIRSQKNAVANLKQAVSDKNFDAVLRIAHNLKGMSGLLDETHLMKLAENIEVLAGVSVKNKFHESICAEGMSKKMNTGDFADISQAIDEIALEHARVIASISPPGGKPKGDKKASAKLEKLAVLLEERNISCLDLLDELRELPEAAVLVRQTENYEFAGALATLRTLQEIWNVE